MAVLDLVLGPTVVGVIFNVFLYGTMCMQCYNYFITFPEDTMNVRLLVWFLLIADTANTVFECIVLYGYTITDFGDFNAVAHGNWRAGTGPILAGIIAAAVQGFLAHRVYRLSKWLWLTVPIYVGIVVQLVAAVTVGVIGSIVTSFAKWGEWQIKVPIVTWLILAAVVDCAITSILTFYLRRNRTGFASTDHMISGLVRLTVETGMITAVWTVLDLILYLTIPKPVHLIFNLALPKLYTNTLMCTLNSRLRTGGRDDSDSTKVQTDATWKDCEHVSNASNTVAEGLSADLVHRTSPVHRDAPPFDFGETEKREVIFSSPEDDLDEKQEDDFDYKLDDLSDVDLGSNSGSQGERGHGDLESNHPSDVHHELRY